MPCLLQDIPLSFFQDQRLLQPTSSFHTISIDVCSITWLQYTQMNRPQKNTPRSRASEEVRFGHMSVLHARHRGEPPKENDHKNKRQHPVVPVCRPCYHRILKPINHTALDLHQQLLDLLLLHLHRLVERVERRSHPCASGMREWNVQVNARASEGRECRNIHSERRIWVK